MGDSTLLTGGPGLDIAHTGSYHPAPKLKFDIQNNGVAVPSYEDQDPMALAMHTPAAADDEGQIRDADFMTKGQPQQSQPEQSETAAEHVTTTDAANDDRSGPVEPSESADAVDEARAPKTQQNYPIRHTKQSTNNAEQTSEGGDKGSCNKQGVDGTVTQTAKKAAITVVSATKEAAAAVAPATKEAAQGKKQDKKQAQQQTGAARRDGVMFPWDTFRSLRRMGYGLMVSFAAATAIHGGLSYTTLRSWLPDPRLPLYVDNLPASKAVSDTKKLEEMFAAYDHEKKGGLGPWDIASLAWSRRSIWNMRSWLNDVGAWSTLWLAAHDKHGVVKKDLVDHYDGSLWQLAAQELQKSQKRGAPAPAAAPAAGAGAAGAQGH